MDPIKKKYPNFLTDKKKIVDRYKISESSKNVLVNFRGPKPKHYWDLSSGKYTNPINGQILIASLINSVHKKSNNIKSPLNYSIKDSLQSAFCLLSNITELYKFRNQAESTNSILSNTFPSFKYLINVR